MLEQFKVPPRAGDLVYLNPLQKLPDGATAVAATSALHEVLPLPTGPHRICRPRTMFCRCSFDAFKLLGAGDGRSVDPPGDVQAARLRVHCVEQVAEELKHVLHAILLSLADVRV